jgi:SPP1 family predicted phage head-tail adaptor
MAAPGAGTLDKRIVIETLTQTKDSEGGMSDAWGSPINTWAKIANLSGNERHITAHGGQVAEARTEFTIRYRTGINEKMRVTYNSKIYNIRFINDFAEDHRFLVLTCDTGVNDGR